MASKEERSRTNKSRVKKLKKLKRSELLEVMIALKRENDRLRMQNVQIASAAAKREEQLFVVIREFSELTGNIDALELLLPEDDGTFSEENFSEPDFDDLFEKYVGEVMENA